MPVTKSAKKAQRNAENKASNNRHRKEVIKKTLKSANPDTLSSAQAILDKAVKWGIFHRNKVNRLKSRLAKSVTAGVETKPKTKKTATTKSKVKKSVSKKKK